MGLPFGVSFLPGGDAQYQRDQNGSMGTGGVPVQQAIKILSMRVPRVVGQNPLAPLSLLTGPGGQGLPPGLLDHLLRQQSAPAPAGGVPQALVPPSLPSVAAQPSAPAPPIPLPGPPSSGPPPATIRASAAMAAPPAIPSGVPPMAAPPSPGMASPVAPPPPALALPSLPTLPAPPMASTARPTGPILSPVISGAPTPQQNQPTMPEAPTTPTTPYKPKIIFQGPPEPPAPPGAAGPPLGPLQSTPPPREDIPREGVRGPSREAAPIAPPLPPETLPVAGPPGQQAQAGDSYTNQDQTDEQMRRILEMLLGGGQAQAQVQ